MDKEDIYIKELKGEVIRGKRAKLPIYMDGYEENDVDLSFLDEFINKESININSDEVIFMSSSRKTE